MARSKSGIKKSADILDVIRPAIREIQAYTASRAGDAIKLDAMENPYAWPVDIKQDWLEYLQRAKLNRYPDPSAESLREALRRYYTLPANEEILFGNGSDELILMLFMALAKPGAKVLAPTPTFVMYEVLARAVGMEFIGVPLADDFKLDLRAMQRTIKEHQPAIICLAYPNNPTANLFATQDIEGLIECAPGLVLIDEAYSAFTPATFLPRLREFPRVLVMRTLSKLGLAGLRIGALMGNINLLHEIDKLRLPYNIGTLNQLTAEFVLQRPDFLLQQVKQIINDRAALYHALAEMPGVEVWPSETNFLLFRISDKSASDVFAALKQNGILIKNMGAHNPLLKNCLRVTVGAAEENELFLKALGQLL